MNEGFEMQIIHGYSREQAISDGVLIDVSKMAKEAGFKIPVAVTQTVWQEVIKPSEIDVSHWGQSAEGRLWDTLFMMRVRSESNRDVDRFLFDVIYRNKGKKKKIKLMSMIGPGDRFEPVLTVQMPNEYQAG